MYYRFVLKRQTCFGRSFPNGLFIYMMINKEKGIVNITSALDIQSFLIENKGVQMETLKEDEWPEYANVISDFKVIRKEITSLNIEGIDLTINYGLS
jgi:hypothetical protein